MKMCYVSIFAGLFVCLCLGCGIFDPASSTGTLKVIFEESPVEQSMKKTADGSSELRAVQCIVKNNEYVFYWKPIWREQGEYRFVITDLNPYLRYTLLLYGQAEHSVEIDVCAYASDIEIRKGRETAVQMAWYPFMTQTLLPNEGEKLGKVRDILFLWNPVDGALQYHIKIASDSLFMSPVVSTIVTDAAYSINTEGLLSGTYYWKVKCCGHWRHIDVNDPWIHWGDWSEVSCFSLHKDGNIDNVHYSIIN